MAVCFVFYPQDCQPVSIESQTDSS